jgi:hypothetical protein
MPAIFAACLSFWLAELWENPAFKGHVRFFVETRRGCIPLIEITSNRNKNGNASNKPSKFALRYNNVRKRIAGGSKSAKYIDYVLEKRIGWSYRSFLMLYVRKNLSLVVIFFTNM